MMESPGCNERARAYAAIFVRCASIGILWLGVAGLRGSSIVLQGFARSSSFSLPSFPFRVISLEFRFRRVSQRGAMLYFEDWDFGSQVIRSGEDNRKSSHFLNV